MGFHELRPFQVSVPAGMQECTAECAAENSWGPVAYVPCLTGWTALQRQAIVSVGGRLSFEFDGIDGNFLCVMQRKGYGDIARDRAMQNPTASNIRAAMAG
jgi:hypothetical protein